MKAIYATLLPIWIEGIFLNQLNVFFYRLAALAMREGPHTHAHLLLAGVPSVGLTEEGSFRFIVALTHYRN